MAFLVKKAMKTTINGHTFGARYLELIDRGPRRTPVRDLTDESGNSVLANQRFGVVQILPNLSAYFAVFFLISTFDRKPKARQTYGLLRLGG
jgi:hypothetical protein